jgi:hypothetical protein
MGPLLEAARRTAKFQEAQNRLRDKIEQEEKRRGKRLLFYYRDPSRVMFIAATGMLPTTRANGVGFPAGAYATDVSPADNRFTQRQLSAAFFGDHFANYGNNPSVSYFVAFFADILWSPLLPRLHPDVAHWHKAAPFPGAVPIEVVATGPNLMAP